MILEGGNIYNHSGLSRNWLHQDMLPGNVQMRRQVVYNATGYHYQEGCQFILVDHGGGCLIVNGDAYSLEAGSCCLLFVHHFYSIKPSQSVPLTLLSCLFSYSTYTFLTTISQFDFLSIDVPSPPNFANFFSAGDGTYPADRCRTFQAGNWCQRKKHSLPAGMVDQASSADWS